MMEGNDGFVRADQIDLKSLDEQLQRHLSRAWTMEKKKKEQQEEQQVARPTTRQEWEIDPSKLTIKSVIARGTFGTVHRGVYDGQDVAVKLLDWGEEGHRTDAEISSLRTAFTQEVAVWHKLDHPNVTKFIGATMGTSELNIQTDNGHIDLPRNVCCVVVEYLPGGALKSFLIKNRRKKLAFKVVVQLALDLARGLNYLHSEKIVHRDVKTENMLLDKTRTVKIADFGVARVSVHSNGSSECFTKIPEIKFKKLFINGKFVDSISGKTFETIDPRTGEVIARIAEGDKEDVDLAVKAARDAFDQGPWPRLPGSARGKMMLKFADLIDENIEELAALDTIDAGKLFNFGKIADIPGTAENLRYYAGAADKIHGETLKMSSEHQGYTLREPIGVVGLIIPWNFPSTLFFLKVAPALAAGCTMVVKPAEQTPLSALYYAHLAKLAGIPDGVINVITGYGPTAGAAISSHMDIDKVSFTGSTEVGRLVMQAAATSNLKAVSLELGGKSPLIIFDDADVDKAADLALLGILFNKGEICVAGSRVFVQEGIYDELVKKLAKKAKTWVVGDPFDPTVRQGPQVDKIQFDKILSYIEHGKREGATLLTGGKPCGKKGYYVEPTIFTNVTDEMKIAKEEIFGPVMSLMKFKTVEEAIQRANATKYGLAAGIMTNNLNVANTVSRSIRAGVIWINCYFAFDRDCPYGGYKMSGFGRDMGMQALDNYLQVKSVVTPIYDSPWL